MSWTVKTAASFIPVGQGELTLDAVSIFGRIICVYSVHKTDSGVTFQAVDREQNRIVRRARRYPFAVHVELTNLDSESHLQERTTDLSLFGCGVATKSSFSVGAKVRIRITHKGHNFTALGKVIYVRPFREMGIAFTHIEDNDQETLEKWISELRDQS